MRSWRRPAQGEQHRLCPEPVPISSACSRPEPQQLEIAGVHHGCDGLAAAVGSGASS
jgi:hypothetical protein